MNMSEVWQEWQRMQWMSLQRQFLYVKHLSPFYREKFRDISDVRTPDDWRDVPVTRKQELTATYENDPDIFGGRLCIREKDLAYAHDIHDPYSPHPPLMVGYSLTDKENVVRYLVDAFRAMDIANGEVMQVQGFNNEALSNFCILNISGTGSYSSPTVTDLMGLQAVGLDISPREARRTYHTAKLLKPETILTNVRHLRALQTLLEQHGERLGDLRYQKVVLRIQEDDEEHPLAETRQQLIRQGVDEVYYLLYVPEALLFATECAYQDGFHFPEEEFFLEVTSEDGQALPVGEWGTLTITNLFHAATPLLRYQTRFQAKLQPQPCRCGRLAFSIGGGFA